MEPKLNGAWAGGIGAIYWLITSGRDVRTPIVERLG